MKISIITVCFNSDATIADTLDSVRSQAYPYLEYIIVDGGSSDKTLAVINSKLMPSHKLISEQDSGIYDAMNKGIALATGEIIGFINADDFYPSSDVISKVVKVFENSRVDCCYGDLLYVEQENTSKIVRYWRSCPFVAGLFGKGWCPPHPTFFVRREVYERLGAFNLNFKIAADVELMARFLEVEGISSYYLPEVLVHMRMGGTTNRSLSNVIKQNLEVRRGLLALGLGFSWMRFLGNKVFSRAWQFVRRPV
ncbi:glycosyltransferase family 2 protein [Limnohabitans sp. DCL3]|uniref:glycosyltransferase family 2 protein n=1 Tax=Limnohabitans sp. DCL3 TaxID=3374103 RepID=UPI003A8A2824